MMKPVENGLILHVAEKPSIATSIAKALSRGSSGGAEKRGMCPTHTFATSHLSFPGQGRNGASMPLRHRVTSVVGHVFSLDFPKEYASWDSVDPQELFDAPVVKKPTKKGVLKHLQQEAKGIQCVVLWMDCDREGENINFEVLDVIGWTSEAHKPKIFRAKFSAINEKDIVQAYNTLIRPNENESLSVDARQELDLKVGVAFSRFQTRFFQGRYGDLDSSVISYGPCQTPTLGFCVQRHLDIITFVPKAYWTIDLSVVKSGISVKCSSGHGRYFKKSQAEAVLKSVE